MQKRTREILALLLLLLLGLLAAAGMGWYILVGHNWNVAATNIDDSVGQMEGYTVFLVEGTRPIIVSGEDVAGPNATERKMLGATSIASHTTADKSFVHSEPAYSDSFSKIVADYKAKKAEVVVIRNWALGAYDVPHTMRIGKRDISVFEVNYPARGAAVRTQVNLLKRRGSDFNVLITNDVALEGTEFEDVEIIICTNPNKEREAGRYRAGIYCADVPNAGQVEAIIVSPSGVISSKSLNLTGLPDTYGQVELLGPFLTTQENAYGN